MKNYKVCITCKENKSLFEFPTHKEMRDGHLNVCKECHRARCREYYAANREKRCESHRKWAKEHRAHCNEYQKRNRSINRAYVNEYMRRKRAEDPIWYYSMKLFYPIRYVMSRKGECESKRAEEITGLSPKELYDYLLWTWKERYGKDWNGEVYDIDHIIPRSTAKTKEDVDRLFRYKNLRLLSPTDNRSNITSL